MIRANPLQPVQRDEPLRLSDSAAYILGSAGGHDIAFERQQMVDERGRPITNSAARLRDLAVPGGWSDELGEAVTQRLDVIAWKESPPNIGPAFCPLPYSVFVPVVPTFDAWAWVVIDDPDDDGTRGASWVRLDPAVLNHGGTPHVQPVTTLSRLYPGDSLQTMRMEILDWIYSTWQALECPSSAHVGRRKIFQQTTDLPGSDHVARAVRVLIRDRCDACHARLGGAQPDVPDV